MEKNERLIVPEPKGVTPPRRNKVNLFPMTISTKLPTEIYNFYCDKAEKEVRKVAEVLREAAVEYYTKNTKKNQAPPDINEKSTK